MELHKKAHVLCNTMRASHPVREADDSPRLKMLVANQPQVDVMLQELPSLLGFLRSTLANDFIEITVQVNDDPDSPAAWSDRELLRHIVEANPHAAEFIADMHLTIS